MSPGRPFIHPVNDKAQYFHIEVSKDDSKAVDLLAKASDLSRQGIKAAMQKGAVWLTRNKYCQRLRRASKILAEGDILDFYYNPQVLEAIPATAQLVADEGQYSIWFKPRGMLSQGSKWGDHCTIQRWVEQHLQPQRPAFGVHRLDRATAGLMLIAHSKSMAATLSRMFRQREIEKHYRACVMGQFPQDSPVTTIRQPLQGKPAISHIRLRKYSATENRSWLDIHLETGRKHQIRKHLASAGFPVIGDRLYGDGEQSEDLALVAVSLSFTCPVSGKDRKFRLNEAQMPANCQPETKHAV